MSILGSNPLLIGALIPLAVVVVLGVPRERRRGSHLPPISSMEASISPSTPPVSKRRRTNLVTDEEWQAFQEVKAGITGQKGETAVARQLALLDAPALHDVILADRSGLTQIDHLVLGPDAILVLETKTYAGFIEGGLNCQQWTQHLAQGTTRTNFRNPIRQNHRHRMATLEIVSNSDVLVRGYVVSAGKARFEIDAGVRLPEYLCTSPAKLGAALDKIAAAPESRFPRSRPHGVLLTRVEGAGAGALRTLGGDAIPVRGRIAVFGERPSAVRDTPAVRGRRTYPL